MGNTFRRWAGGVEGSLMDERFGFVARLLDGEAVACPRSMAQRLA
jgi:hypothetical protein